MLVCNQVCFCVSVSMSAYSVPFYSYVLSEVPYSYHTLLGSAHLNFTQSVWNALCSVWESLLLLLQLPSNHHYFLLQPYHWICYKKLSFSLSLSFSSISFLCSFHRESMRESGRWPIHKIDQNGKESANMSTHSHKNFVYIYAKKSRRLHERKLVVQRNFSSLFFSFSLCMWNYVYLLLLQHVYANIALCGGGGGGSMLD